VLAFLTNRSVRQFAPATPVFLTLTIGKAGKNWKPRPEGLKAI